MLTPKSIIPVADALNCLSDLGLSCFSPGSQHDSGTLASLGRLLKNDRYPGPSQSSQIVNPWKWRGAWISGPNIPAFLESF